MTGWKHVVLGELFRLKHGFAFKSEYYRASGDRILLTPGNFKAAGGLKSRGEKEKYYEGPVPDGFMLHQHDLLVVMTDLTQDAPILGSAAFVPESQRFLHNQRLGKVTELCDEVDVRFAYYLLNSPSVRAQIRSTASGSTVRHTSPDRIYAVEAALPPIGEQLRIAATLAAYDELIENNLRRIEILEEMAQAVYREWFVEFRYPGHEDIDVVDSPVGPIPKGWEVSTLGEASTVVMGQSPRSEFYNDIGEGLPFHQGVTNFGDHFPVHLKYCTVESRIAEAGDTLVSVRAPVGRLNVADTRLVIGRGLAAVRGNDAHPGFHYRQLRDVFHEEDLMGGGTIYKAIKKGDLLGIPWILPDLEIRASFDLVERPMFSMMRNLTEQNTNLRSTRDLLLPKLVAGELDVSDLDIETEWLAS